jgi:hypothetical protein
MTDGNRQTYSTRDTGAWYWTIISDKVSAEKSAKYIKLYIALAAFGCSAFIVKLMLPDGWNLKFRTNYDIVFYLEMSISVLLLLLLLRSWSEIENQNYRSIPYIFAFFIFNAVCSILLATTDSAVLGRTVLNFLVGLTVVSGLRGWWILVFRNSSAYQLQRRVWRGEVNILASAWRGEVTPSQAFYFVNIPVCIALATLGASIVNIDVEASIPGDILSPLYTVFSLLAVTQATFFVVSQWRCGLQNGYAFRNFLLMYVAVIVAELMAALMISLPIGWLSQII